MSFLVTMSTGIALILLLATLPGSLYLALLTVTGLLPPKRRNTAAALAGRIALVVPAHNEADGLTRTLENMLAISAKAGNSEVVVIADNCSDATADVARAVGARVIERTDLLRRGKGYALDHAFSVLASESYVAYAVIDADSVADANFIEVLRTHFGTGARAVQARYTVLNAGDSPRTRLAEIALAGFNILRPRGRDRLGLSVGLFGNGFALRSEVLQQVPYTASSVVEDLEYHLRLVEAGIKVVFADDTTVRGDMPSGEQGNRTQRSRWEGGRLRMIRESGFRLAMKILNGDSRFIDPLADLCLLPLAYHVLLLLLATVFGIGHVSLVWPLVAAGLAIVFAHILAALRVAHLPLTRLSVLARIPAYLLWKLSMAFRITSGSKTDSEWIRTDRNGT
jgi:cellulose synthase/poly-beta-1,6-N-acetylglucosamine synthase-like glycosyltransferase